MRSFFRMYVSYAQTRGRRQFLPRRDDFRDTLLVLYRSSSYGPTDDGKIA